MSQDKKQISQKGLLVTLKVQLLKENVQKAYKQNLVSLSSKVELKGFRKGSNALKIQALEKQRGQIIREEAIDKMLQKIVSEVVSENKHRVASQFTITKRDGDGVEKDVSVELTYEVFSDIPEDKVEKLSINTVKAKIGEDSVKAEIEKLQEHYGEWVEVKRAAKDGDQLKIDFAGRLDGELFEGGSATDQELTLGSGQFIPGFEDNLVGKKGGDETTFKIKFPKDYHSKNLAGKEVEFEVRIQNVKEKKLLEVGKKLFEVSGTKATKKPEFEKEIKERLESDASYLAASINRKRLLAEIKKKISFPVPESLVEQEMEGVKEKNDKLSDKELRTQAESSLMVGLLLRHYIDKWSITASEAQIRDFIMMAAPSGIAPEMFVQWYIQDQNRLDQITGLVLEQNVFDKLLTVVKIKEVLTSVKDLEAELKEE